MPLHNSQKRTELYTLLSSIAKDTVAAQEKLVASGDWNAVSIGTDGGSERLSTVDQQHSSALEQMGLCSLLRRERAKTFSCTLHGREGRMTHMLVRAESTFNRAAPEDVLAFCKVR